MSATDRHQYLKRLAEAIRQEYRSRGYGQGQIDEVKIYRIANALWQARQLRQRRVSDGEIKRRPPNSACLPPPKGDNSNIIPFVRPTHDKS